MNNGFDYLGIDEIGVEGTEAANIASKILSATGGLFSGFGGGSGDKKDDSAAKAELKRLEDEKRKAEESAKSMKLYLAGGIGIAAVIGTIIYTRVNK